jgi:hypothetical protein
MIMCKLPTHPAGMSAAGFAALCESIYGKYWKRPASRALGRDPKMMRLYAKGATAIPPDLVERLLRIADIGPAGEAVKRVLLDAITARELFPGDPRASTRQRVHELAMEIVAELRREHLITPEDRS